MSAGAWIGPRWVNARQLATLRRLAQRDASESELRGPGKVNHEGLMLLVRSGLVTITTLDKPESFDNAYFDHTYRLTDQGRAALKEHQPEPPAPAFPVALDLRAALAVVDLRNALQALEPVANMLPNAPAAQDDPAYHCAVIAIEHVRAALDKLEAAQ